MLKLDNLSKVYRVGAFGGKELRAVSNVSFAIEKGEIISLIGESGSGKSTIGRMILRLIPISLGTIQFNGVDISTLKGAQLKEYYRRVQGVFQDPFSSYNPIFKADRVFRIIRDAFFPGMNDADWKRKINSSLEAVGLNPNQVLNKFPHQLSGGQLQRFLIARALLLDVEFLVADEVISMLDASTRIDVLNLLADLKSRGLSILFITHDLSLGYYISQKSVILHRGRVVEMGSTRKIYNNPQHQYTRMLMASVPRLDQKWEEGAPNTAAAASYDVFSGDYAVDSAALVEVERDHFVAQHGNSPSR
ncbi:MAG: ABC transporter ATP-binding protein [Chloroflexales bacterium]|nr:ABC transporter ATP-binding protein [Chloroflexales bacterium]